MPLKSELNKAEGDLFKELVVLTSIADDKALKQGQLDSINLSIFNKLEQLPVKNEIDPNTSEANKLNSKFMEIYIKLNQLTMCEHQNISNMQNYESESQEELSKVIVQKMMRCYKRGTELNKIKEAASY